MLCIVGYVVGQKTKFKGTPFKETGSARDRQVTSRETALKTGSLCCINNLKWFVSCPSLALRDWLDKNEVLYHVVYY